MKTLNEVANFIVDNWKWIAPLLYEIIVRLVPTFKNYSIISRLIPNNRKTLPLLLLLALASLGSFAQLNGTFKALRLVNVLDSTQVSPVDATIYYNEQSDKIRVYENGAWYDLRRANYTPSNGSGTTVSGTSVNIGGALTTSGFVTLGSGLELDVSVSGSTGGSLNVYNNGSGHKRISLNAINVDGGNAVLSFGNSSTYGNGAKFYDTRTVKVGIEYSGNYAADFSDNSLVNKKFVTDAIAAAGGGGGVTDGDKGDITVTGTGTTWTVDNAAITYAKIQNAAAGLSVVGRSANTSGVNADIAAGTDGNILRRSGTSIGFGAIDLSAAGAVGSSALPAANGGTGNTSYAVGDIPYASASTTISKLADVATGNVLLSGGVATAPAYGKVTSAHVNSTVAVTNTAANSSQTFTGKQIFTTTLTGSGFNFGSFSGNPTSNLADGDAWYDASVNRFEGRRSGGTIAWLTCAEAGLTSTRLVLASGGSVVGDDAGLFYNTTTDLLNAGRFEGTPTSTLPSLGLGTFAGTPSTLVNGDMWVNSSTNILYARINGASVDLSTPVAVATSAEVNTGSDNAKIVSASALTGSKHALSRATPSTAGGTITLDMDSRIQKQFIGSTSFATPKTMAISNVTNAICFSFKFIVTNVAATLTYPSGWLMSDVNFTSLVWTPPATGTYVMSGQYDGTSDWTVTMSGPFQ